MKNKYEIVVGNVGTMTYTNQKLAKECFDTYVTLSKNNETRAAGEPVTFFKNGEIIHEYKPIVSAENKLTKILDFDKCKALIEQAIKNGEACIIIAPNYYINIQSKYEDEESLQFDLDELEEYIGHTLQVSDYNDLIVDLSNGE